jgi:5-methylcytosine-specific restriction protein A
MRDELNRILTEYEAATRQPFTNHPLADFIRNDAPAAMIRALGNEAHGLTPRGSAGMSKWSDSPWIGVLDPLVTSTTQSGYYIVYLFPRAMSHVVLSLQLGTTALREELGIVAARAALRRLTTLVRQRVPEYANAFTTEIDLQPASSDNRAASYELGHAFGRVYGRNLPTDDVLAIDLAHLVQLYRMMTFRGGLDALRADDRPTSQLEAAGYQDYSGEEDRRRIRYHTRIERNRQLAAAAKRVHGYACQACGLTVEKQYGPIGKLYIEAHHLIPLADLPSDHAVRLDPRNDFDVLCANCHRMIHRPDAPRSLQDFRTLIAEQTVGGKGEQ